MLAAVTVLAVAGAAIAWTAGPFGDDSTDTAGGREPSTSLATVEQRRLSSQQQLNGLLGYVGSYTVLGRLPGTVTWLPHVGRVVHQGHMLYRVDGTPVVLLYGAAPAYRSLGEGTYASSVTGRDVAQLNHDLVALGYVDAAEVDSAWDEFGWATRAGVEKLQDALGVPQDGTLDLGEVVFLPSAARITAHRADLGAPATGPVLSATSTDRTVTVGLDPSLRSRVSAGDRVGVTLPDGRSTPGRVSSVGDVATAPSGSGDHGSGDSSSGPTIPVHVRLLHPRAAGHLDQTLVEVTITDRSVPHALAVPVAALLALSGGRDAVEVVDPDGRHRRLQVQVGLFDDAEGLVQVTGSGLAAGQHVVVPGSE